MHKMLITLLGVALAAWLAACNGPRFQMTPTHAETAAMRKPIRDALIIVVIDDPEVKAIFEKHFKDWLAAKGVEAITSTEVLSGREGDRLDKAAIVEAIEKYGNDSVLITHLVGLGDTETFSRSTPGFYGNYYSFYSYAWGYVHWPAVTGEKVQITLESRLYDTTSESLLWAGDSLLTNPETVGKAIGQVVEAVMKELGKNGLLPTKAS